MKSRSTRLRWVGLHFESAAADHGPALTYDIDTHLYDLAHPRFEALSRTVEENIVAFLDALLAGRVRVGTVGRKAALLVPVGTRLHVVTRGRFVRSIQVRRATPSVEAKGSFVTIS